MEHAPTQTSKQPVSKDQCRDAGMALVLLLLIAVLLSLNHKWGLKPDYTKGLVIAAVAALVLNMIYPPLLKLWAKLWFPFTHLLGTVMSKIILSLIFFLVVTPMGLARQLLGKDSMKRKGFKATDDSVMAVRNHTFVGRDLEKPY